MVRNKVLKVAAAHRTDLLFAVADDDEFAELMKKFNLHDSGEDVNVGCKARGQKIFTFLSTVIWSIGYTV